MAAEHWHIAKVNMAAAGSEVMAEVFPDWGTAKAAMRERQEPGGQMLTLRPCTAAKCGEAGNGGA